MKKSLLIILLSAGLFVLDSCGPSEIIVSNRPGRPYYSRPYSPGQGYIWIEGDWVIRGGRYEWNEGRWARSRNRLWIAGEWEPRDGGWRWRKGYWR